MSRENTATVHPIPVQRLFNAQIGLSLAVDTTNCWPAIANDLWRTLFRSAEGLCPRMAKNVAPRLLEVTVRALQPELWKWQVSESQTEIKYDYEMTRETAQIRGDSALFELLSENLNN